MADGEWRVAISNRSGRLTFRAKMCPRRWRSRLAIRHSPRDQSVATSIRSYHLCCMAEQDQTYDEGRARNLEALLRALAQRINELDDQGRLLAQAGELMRLIGDVRSELFHYEVRITYDTPEIAEHRRIVGEAEKPDESKWQTNEWKPDEGEKPEW